MSSYASRERRIQNFARDLHHTGDVILPFEISYGRDSEENSKSMSTHTGSKIEIVRIEDIRLIARAIANIDKPVESLILSCWDISRVFFQEVAREFELIPIVSTSIFLESFRENEIDALAHFLRRKDLRQLGIKCDIEDAIEDNGLHDIVQFLQQRGCTNLVDLRLSNCKTTSIGTELIASFAMRNLSSLKNLTLDRNKINDGGVEHLARYLEAEDCSLIELNLSHNKIGDAGAMRIGVALQKNRKLEFLDLTQNNDLTDGGMSTMLTAFYNSESLLSVTKSNHEIECIRLGPTVSLGIRRQLKTSFGPYRPGKNHKERRTKKQIVKKVRKYIDETDDLAPFAEFNFDRRLIPNVISFVGDKRGGHEKNNGLTNVFKLLRTWNTPTLFGDPSFMEQMDVLENESAMRGDELEPSRKAKRKLGKC